jgi:hypothetical protein
MAAFTPEMLEIASQLVQIQRGAHIALPGRFDEGHKLARIFQIARSMRKSHLKRQGWGGLTNSQTKPVDHMARLGGGDVPGEKRRFSMRE